MINEMKVRLSKIVCEIFDFRFRFVLIKVYIFVQQNGVRKIAPEENCPRSGSGFGLGLALELGLGAIFLGGNFPRTQQNTWTL